MPHGDTRGDTMAVIDTYWADSLGCDLRQLHTPGVSIVRNAGRLADYSGAYLLRWGKTCLFSVSERFFERAACQARERVPDEVFDPGFLASLFDDHVERIIGPASHNCTDASDFRPVDGRGTRLLDGADEVDEAALRRLAAACDPEEWEHSAIGSASSMTFGCFVGDELVAAGMLRSRGAVRDIGIVTHPAYRRQGNGRAVVAAMASTALRVGAIPQYQTLVANVASLAIARSLGFYEYTRTLAVRLRDL